MSEQVIVHVELDRDFVQQGRQHQEVCTRIVLQTSDAFARQCPKSDCHLLLLLDASHSMNGHFSANHPHMTKREGVLEAVRAMLPQLQPDDRVSVAFFASRSWMVARDLPGSAPDKIMEAVDKLNEHGGATNFASAFQVAQQWLQGLDSVSGSKRILFLTDGNDTLGQWDAAKALSVVVSEQGATVDTMGVGEDFAFDEMRTLSQPSGGTTELLEAPVAAGQHFRAVLHHAQRALVHDVLLRLRIPPTMRDVECYQIVPEIRFSEPLPDATGWSHHTIRVGALYHHQIASLLVRGTIDTTHDGPSLPLFQCRLDYSIPALGITAGNIEETVRLNTTPQAHQELRDTSVSTEYLEASLVRDEMLFRQCHQTDWQRAAKILGQMEQKAHRAGLSDKAQAYQFCRKKLMDTHKLSQDQLNRLMARTSRSTRARLQPQRKNDKAPVF